MKFCMSKESVSRFVSLFNLDFLSLPLSHLFSVPNTSSVLSTWVLLDCTKCFGCCFPPISLFLFFILKMYEFCYQNYPLNISLTRILASPSRMSDEGKLTENCFKWRIIFKKKINKISVLSLETVKKKNNSVQQNQIQHMSFKYFTRASMGKIATHRSFQVT